MSYDDGNYQVSIYGKRYLMSFFEKVRDFALYIIHYKRQSIKFSVILNSELLLLKT